MENKHQSLIFDLLFIFAGCLHVEALSTTEFYPFGSSTIDRKLRPNDDDSSGRIAISVPFPFFSDKYNSLFVNTNGVISFRNNLVDFTPDVFPVNNSRKLIAPFWADVDIRNGGDVFYRESKNVQLLRRVTDDVKRHFPGQFRSFRASWIFIATWYNVARYIRQFSIFRRRSDNLRNTFQAVLTTNGRHSFAIFLYNKTEWTTGDASKGRNGHGGIPAQAGFNFGDGRRYESIEGSLTSSIKQLPSLTNIGVPGKFMFRVDEAQIEQGGCNTAGGLTLSPKSGIVLGGTHISVSGPCFKPTDIIVCRFNRNLTTDGNYESEFEGSCVSPPLNRIGKIPLEISLDNGTTFNFTGVFTSVAVGRHGPEVSGLVGKDWTSQINPLYLAWNPDHLKTKTVHIEVAKFDWDSLKLLEETIVVKENVDNFGFHTVKDLVETATPKPTDTTASKALLSPLAAITIRAQTPTRGLPARVYSALFLTIPTNISEEIKMAYNKHGIYLSCQDWFVDDDTDVWKLRNELLGCPRSLEQAEADNGRFQQGEVCRPPRKASCEVYHNGSYHCFRSIFPSPSGAGQQCCYDKEGKLVVGPPGGGTLDKYHPKSSRFASLRHLKYDVYGWYLCCRLSKFCGVYYQKRPSDDGSRYRPPQITTLFGDPHLITLDGLSYTFNGYGEYTVLNIEENGFKFQARMQPLDLESGGKSRGTFLMALSLKDRESDTVQVELNSLGLLDIFVNGGMESFDQQTSVLDFKGFKLARRPDTVTQIIFSSGIVVNVKQNDMSLSFDMMLPETFKGKTRGLLGVWDDRKDNDFTLPDGQTLDINALNSSQIHWMFGQMWSVNANQSLFVYPDEKQREDYVNRTYEPLFLDEKNLTFVNKRLEKEARELCQGVKECLFDIAVTGLLSFGNTTKNAIEEFNQKKKDMNIVRVPVYYNCDGDRVTDACDACGTSCEKHSNTLAIALAVTFSIIAAVAIAALVLFFLWRKRQLKSIGEKKQPRNGPHAKANNGFSLPFKS